MTIMKKILLFTLCFFSIFITYSQHAIGDWISFNSFETISLVEEADDKTYYVSNNCLYSYDKKDKKLQLILKAWNGDLSLERM